MSTFRIHKFLNALLLDRKFSLPPELRHSERITRALPCVVEKEGSDRPRQIANMVKPVFILSAGWRSGSTLLQRLIVSSGKIAVWGEPFGEAAVIHRLAETLTALTHDWPPETFFGADSDLQNMTGNWIANLTPDLAYFRTAHRAFFENWLARPAKTDFGVDRWGLKEVRLTIDHACYLKWLFPDACFLFIYRNPISAYRSWKGNAWYSPWSRYYTHSPIAFTLHWKRLLKGFINGHQQVGGLLIKFEDLVEGRIPLETIAAHIDVEKLDTNVLKHKVVSPGGKRTRRYEKVNPIEQLIIKTLAYPIMKPAGYIHG